MKVISTDEMLDFILELEGGFVDHPADRGGWTNYGITLSTLQAWRGKSVGREDVLDLTRDEARDIYGLKYHIEPRLTCLSNWNIEFFMFDCAVHHGPTQAIRWLQATVKTTPDGILGPITQEAANFTPGAVVLSGLVAKRLDFFMTTVNRDPLQDHFFAGWLNRLNKVLTFIVEHNSSPPSSKQDDRRW